MLTCQRAARMAEHYAKSVNTTAHQIPPDPAPVNTKPRNADRHKPGYMAEFMRKDRAKKKAAKNGQGDAG